MCWNITLGKNLNQAKSVCMKHVKLWYFCTTDYCVTIKCVCGVVKTLEHKTPCESFIHYGDLQTVSHGPHPAPHLFSCGPWVEWCCVFNNWKKKTLKRIIFCDVWVSNVISLFTENILLALSHARFGCTIRRCFELWGMNEQVQHRTTWPTELWYLLPACYRTCVPALALLNAKSRRDLDGKSNLDGKSSKVLWRLICIVSHCSVLTFFAQARITITF